LKKIFIKIDDNLYFFDDTKKILIDIFTETITTDEVITNDNYINNKKKNLHSIMKIKYGNFDEELPEQKMAVRYLHLFDEIKKKIHGV